MAWAERLVSFFCKDRVRKGRQSVMNTNMFEGESGDARVLSTLLANISVGGNEVTAQAIQSAGRRVVFCQGEDIIVQGASDDDVFFLLFGDVEILVDTGYRQVRSAPTQVGEMAAIDSGAPRSATVRAKTQPVVAWKVSAQNYRKIMNADAVALRKVQREVRDRQRQLIGWKPVKGRWGQLAYWTAVSLIAAVFGGGVTWFALDVAAPAMGDLESALMTGLITVVLFVFTMTLNPAFFYRRMIAWIIGTFALSFLLDWSISARVYIGDTITEFSLNANGTDLDWAIGLTVVIPFLLLVGFFAYVEHKRQSD